MTRNDVNAIPNTSPAYLARSPASIFKATRSICCLLLRSVGNKSLSRERSWPAPRRTLASRILDVAVQILDRWRLDEYVHLLANEDRQGAAIKAVNDLENTRVGALSARAGERPLGNHEGFDALELQGSVQSRIAAHEGPRRRLAVESPGVVLIDVCAYKQPGVIAKDQQRCAEPPTLRKFTRSQVDLQDTAGHRSTDCTALDLRSECFTLCPQRPNGGLGAFDFESAHVDLLAANETTFEFLADVQ